MLERGPYNRVFVLVYDGVGAGFAENRRKQHQQDVGMNSLVNASQHELLRAPALESMGLLNIPSLAGLKTFPPEGEVIVKGAYGVLTPTAQGNGSPEGHQGLMGHIVDTPYLYFNETGFSPEVIELVESTVAKVLHREVEVIRYPNTDDINGEKFIEEIGDAHVASKSSGKLKIPIYSSTDSVLQIALHQSVVPQKDIEAIGIAVRQEINVHGLRIGRVIMRPFVDNTDHTKDAKYARVSGDRRDYGVDPDKDTVIDHLARINLPVYGIGKAASMLNNHGFKKENIAKLDTDVERMVAVVRAVDDRNKKQGLWFVNLIYTDEKYGHPRKPVDYIQHINLLDVYTSGIQKLLRPTDLLIVTADHGNDPTQKRHSNHTNEVVPLLVYTPNMKGGINLGVRGSFADLAKTIAENYGVADQLPHGVSFLQELLKN